MSIPCQRPDIYIIQRRGLFERGVPTNCPRRIDYSNFYYSYQASSMNDDQYTRFYTVLEAMQGHRYLEIKDVGWYELDPRSVPRPIQDSTISEFLQNFNDQKLLGPTAPFPFHVPTSVVIFEVVTIYDIPLRI